MNSFKKIGLTQIAAGAFIIVGSAVAPFMIHSQAKNSNDIFVVDSDGFYNATKMNNFGHNKRA